MKKINKLNNNSYVFKSMALVASASLVILSYPKIEKDEVCYDDSTRTIIPMREYDINILNNVSLNVENQEKFERDFMNWFYQKYNYTIKDYLDIVHVENEYIFINNELNIYLNMINNTNEYIYYDIYQLNIFSDYELEKQMIR